MNLAKILQMFGVNVKPEHVKAAEELIPKLPGIVEQVVKNIDTGMKQLNERLESIEQRLERIEDAGRRSDDSDDSDTRPAGVGATQRVLESNGSGLGAD